MGRRIYDDDNRFVWKYTFGRQGSNMCIYTENFSIGKYVTSNEDNGEDGYKSGEDGYYEWEEHSWVINPKVDLPKLKLAYKKILNGHTDKELATIGMKAVHTFVNKQSVAWKKHFAEDLKWVDKAKSCDNFLYYGCGGSGYSFEVYDIYAKAVEKKLIYSIDFLLMTRAFIKHIEKYKAKVFIDEY